MSFVINNRIKYLNIAEYKRVYIARRKSTAVQVILRFKTFCIWLVQSYPTIFQNKKYYRGKARVGYEKRGML